MTKSKKAGKPLTKIEGGKVSMSRASWDWFTGEVDKAIGITVPDVELGKGRTVAMPIEVWATLLAVVDAALAYSGYLGAENCEQCCDEACEGHGGMRFCFGSACVCNDCDLFNCGA